MEYRPVFTYQDTRVYCNLCELVIFFKTGQGKLGHILHKHRDITIVSKQEGGRKVYYYGHR